MNPVFYNNPNTLKQKNLSKNNKNNQINIGLTYNENKEKSKSRNYKNDYSLFYNKTSNQVNRDKGSFVGRVVFRCNGLGFAIVFDFNEIHTCINL